MKNCLLSSGAGLCSLLAFTACAPSNGDGTGLTGTDSVGTAASDSMSGGTPTSDSNSDSASDSNASDSDSSNPTTSTSDSASSGSTGDGPKFDVGAGATTGGEGSDRQIVSQFDIPPNQRPKGSIGSSSPIMVK